MKNKSILLTLGFVFICACFFSQPASCAYNYRKRITFDPTKVSGPSDLTDFPVLISITADSDLRTVANSGHVESASGFDIIFTANDGVTLLNFQFEKYVATSGLYTAWVKIPVLSTSINTDIYMYYGNTAIVTNQSSSSVWTNYQSVWHLENNSFSDNSPSGYNLNNNSTTNQSPAFINDGRADNGTQWLESTTFPNLTTNFSMSAWIYTTNNAQAGQRIFCDDVNNSGGYALSIGDNGAGSLRFFSRNVNPVSLDAPNNTITNNTWYFVTAVADITNLTRKIYVNGVQVASTTHTGAWGTDVGNASAAGETASGETANRLNGRIDEVRIAKSALSADWILTEYNNQNSPSTFYSITVEPAVWDGSNNGNWNTGANWVSGSVPGSLEDIIIPDVSPSNQPNLNQSKQISSLWIRTGATLNLNTTRVLSVAYDITNCGTIIGNGTSVLNMNATSSEAQVQNISGSGTYSLTNLTINNTYSASPSVLLNKDVSVSSGLTLTSGLVYTSATNILALGTGATSTSGSASSFISGPISKDGTANFIFPTGKGTRWRRTSVTNISASSTFRAEYFATAFTNTTPVNAPLNNVSSIEYWQVDRTVGAGNANLSLYWEDATGSGINNCPDLTIARWNGASWDERPGTTVGGSSCSGTGTGIVLSNAVITAFSPFTFGSKLSGVNPLPINLLDFKASCNSKDVLLNWSTATEDNNDHFVLERSFNGEDWLDINHTKGSGTSSVKNSYSFSDPFISMETVYYKLTQVDVDGKKESFPIITVSCITTEENMFIYPNPASNEVAVRFDLSKDYGTGTLKVIDNLGRLCSQKPIDLKKGSETYLLPLTLPPGSYSILFFSEQLVFPARKLIVK